MSRHKGFKHSEETKRKISESHKGIFLSEEHRKKLSESHKGNTNKRGKHISKEAKRKIGENSKEMWKRPGFKERMSKKFSEILKGHPTSKETKRKISEAQKGKKGHWYGTHLSDETKRKISENAKTNPNFGMKGKHLVAWNKGLTKETDERVRRYGGKQKGIIFSEERRKKMSEAKEGLTGEKSNHWLGGISFDPYTPDFNGNFKRKIRKRDNYKCMICGKPQKELKRQLDVHHIDYNKLNSFPQNCVSLCISCHMKTQGNRKQWTTFFQSLLKEKYGYQYTQDQKIILDFVEA